MHGPLRYRNRSAPSAGRWVETSSSTGILPGHPLEAAVVRWPPIAERWARRVRRRTTTSSPVLFL